MRDWMLMAPLRHDRQIGLFVSMRREYWFMTRGAGMLHGVPAGAGYKVAAISAT
jgi:hypothetical protein